MADSLKEATMQIKGMTCAACSARIEKGLNKMPGVEEANVNLALERSTIHYDSSQISTGELEQKILDLGYEVVKEKRDFAITGMTCAACSARIEKVLNKMEGVSFAGVNLAIEKATVEYNPAQTSAKEYCSTY